MEAGPILRDPEFSCRFKSSSILRVAVSDTNLTVVMAAAIVHAAATALTVGMLLADTVADTAAVDRVRTADSSSGERGNLGLGSSVSTNADTPNNQTDVRLSADYR